MQYELKRVDPLRFANVTALVYGVLTLAVSLIFAPIAILASLLGSSNDLGFAGPVFAVVMVLIYPIIGLVTGWIGGILSAAAYNLIVRLTGGVLMEFETPGTTAQRTV